ncbi:MAG TPA: alpha/beta hydrolase [Pseudonocardiaceae bacterium]|nr:alpha/beta hydrolase [Pseudonocardiaceae bacterium]
MATTVVPGTWPSSGTHGTPQTGNPPESLEHLPGIRWLALDRPGYGPSTPRAGRNIASLADDVAAVADAFGVDKFAVLGASGGGPHALACGALLPERVVGVAAVASPAPYGADGLDWFAGMAAAGAAELHAAVAGRAALTAHLTTVEFDPDVFTEADFAMLAGDWAWLGRNAGQAMTDGMAGFVDDDLALVTPWGFDPADVVVPTLLMHGVRDRMVPSEHSEWLANRARPAELWLKPTDGHVSVLTHSEDALNWLRERG